MIIKKAKTKKVRVYRTVEIEPEKYGCNCCKKEIKPWADEKINTVLEVKVFQSGAGETEYLHFCSWRCVLKFLPTIKSNYFVDLPFVHYDQKKNGIGDLLKALKAVK